MFSGTFETANFSQWTQTQCLNAGLASNAEFTRGNAYIVSDVVASGLYAFRDDLPPSTNKSGCEVVKGPRPLALGTDDYYAMEFRLPTNWVEPDVGYGNGGWGMTIAQLHFQYPPIWAGPFQLVAHSNRVNAVLQSGSCAYGSGCQIVNQDQTAVPTGQLALGVWHQLIIHARWAADNSGAVEVWWRRRGQTTWTNTVLISGVPTVQWSPGTSPNTNQDTYDKIGAYRGPSTIPLSVWHDDFCRSTSFLAAASCLN